MLSNSRPLSFVRHVFVIELDSWTCGDRRSTNLLVAAGERGVHRGR